MLEDTSSIESYLNDLEYIGNILNEFKLQKELEIVIHSYKDKKNELQKQQLPWKN